MYDSDKEDKSEFFFCQSTARMIVLTFVCFQDGGVQRDLPDAFQHYDDLCRSILGLKCTLKCFRKTVYKKKILSNLFPKGFWLG